MPLETSNQNDSQLSRARIGSANMRRRQQANEPKYQTENSMEREKLLDIQKDQPKDFKIRQTSVSPHSKERKTSAQRKNSS